MLNNQAAGGREVRRLDFFRPDQMVFLVTHEAVIIENLPDVDMRSWVAKLGSQVEQIEEFSGMRARAFVAELCEQLDDEEHLPQETLNTWSGHLNEQLGSLGWRLIDPQPRSYSLPPADRGGIDYAPSENPQAVIPNGGAFSIIVCNLEIYTQSAHVGVVSNINQMNIDASKINLMDDDHDDDDDDDDGKEEPHKTNAKRVRTKRRLLDLISILDQSVMRQNLDFAGLTVEAVFPNWVASSGQGGKKEHKSDTGGTGGPGSDPVAYDSSLENPPYKFGQLIDELNKAKLYGDGVDVDIVILDTAPSSDDLVFAYKELVSKPLGNRKPPHPILQSLLEPEGLLNLYPATLEERRRMGNTSLNHHGYKMSDHGLFIAGIINSIVPKATIHLIEVLNQFGVGDIETIASGFAKAYAIYSRKRRHIVVNCSLCLDLPDLIKDFPYREGDDERIEAIERRFEQALRRKMKLDLAQANDILDDLRWVIGLRAICERLDEVTGQVVAAAGNDSEKKANGQRNSKNANFPAAFSKVIGVGALPKDAKPGPNGKYEVSSFSNLADKPANTGIMALGGEPGEGKGVLGLYLGEFPLDDTPSGQFNLKKGWARVPSTNANGWAWWAGTSFATPIVTAVVASVLSGPKGSNTTQEILDALDDPAMIQIRMPQATEENEYGIPSSVTQSP